MKSFEEWQRERKIENDNFGKVTAVLAIMSTPISFLARYLQAPPWIITAMMVMLALLSISYAVSQWRHNSKKSRAEKLEMEQRFAREDMELNATVLLPPER